MNLRLLGAILSLIAWVVLAFIVALPTGWVHLLLVLAVLLVPVDILMREKT